MEKRNGDHNSIDISGQQFWFLVAIERTEKRCGNAIMWRCECICGRTDFLASGFYLRSDQIKSCGCMRNALIKAARTTHGKSMVKNKTYHVWACMKARCGNKNHKSYGDYGGRGIVVCDRWQDSFENFYDDMGEAPIGMQIDRINNGLGYFPENCRWATAEQNANNRRNNVLLKFNGRTKTMSEWSRDCGIAHSTLWRRRVMGWSDDRILSTPLRVKKNKVKEYRLER